MIPKYLSAIWAVTAPAMGNHLWQSTLFALVAGLVTLLLRKNRARARYALWLAASVKFLIPFSLLVSLGAHLGKPRTIVPDQTGFYFAVEEVGQPFTPAAGSRVSPVMPSATSANAFHWLPATLVALWLCGFVLVLLVWYVRWRRISAIVREAAPLREGRIAAALRRMERRGGLRARSELLLSPASLEPGIFGIFKPVLIWPQGISEHLQDAHVEAILAHELGHVHRRDNLAAAIHMMVEAIFWFHPLVWWLATRLEEERELACDEEVLRWGSQPRDYAESILKTCEFCVGSSLECVSGVTGADLKKRIIRIMTPHALHNLSLSRKLLLGGLAVAAVAGPVGFGLMNTPQIRAQVTSTTGAPMPSFEVASIKLDRSGEPGSRILREPGGLVMTRVTAKLLISFAYDVKDFQISGGTNWLNSDRYDVDAKIEDADVTAMEKLPPDQSTEQLRLRVQSLLTDRFQLKLHRDSKELPVYALVVAKNGPKLEEAKPGDTYPNAIKGPDGKPLRSMGMMRMGGGEIRGQGIPISNLVMMLSQQLGRSVLDQTGLKGSYNIDLKWTPDQSQHAMPMGPDAGPPPTESAPAPDTSGPSIFTALQEQLGLKLESTKGPVEFLVIDHIEKPSEN